MRTVSDWIRTHALHSVGLSPVFTSEQIAEHVSGRLDKAFALIRARVSVGFLRYESNRGRAPSYLSWLEQSLTSYKNTKNLDALLDVAFYAIAEFQNPSLPGTHYKAEKEERERNEI